MTRYEWLGEKLNRVLERKLEASSQRSKQGLTPARGREEEWNRLNREAEAIRAEMRRIRYGE